MDKWHVVFVCAAVLGGCGPRTPAPSRSAPARPPADRIQSISNVTAQVRALLARGNGDEALARAEGFHRAMVERVGLDGTEAAGALLLVGQVRAARGDNLGALHSFRKALPSLERSLGVDHPLIGEALTAIAGVAIAAGRADEGTDAATRAMDILEHATHPKDLELAAAVTALGHARLALNEAGAAASAFRRALDLRETSLGPSHLLVGMSVRALAAAEYARGNDVLAAPLYERALSIFENNLDTSLELFSDTAVRLALARRGDPAKNEAMLRRALGVVEGKRGRRHVAYVELASAMYSNLSASQTASDVSAQMEELGVRTSCVPEQACKTASPRPDAKERQSIPPDRTGDTMRAMETLRPSFGKCFAAARAKDPNTAGVVQLTLDVGASGSVSFVKAASVGLDDSTIACLVDTARAAKFDPPNEGHAVVLQPLSVEPRANAAAR